MTEEFLIKELDTATRQLKVWWNNKIPKYSYPKKLTNKINFLKAYLKALKLQKDENEIQRVLRRLQGDYWKIDRFVSKLK